MTRSNSSSVVSSSRLRTLMPGVTTSTAASECSAASCWTWPADRTSSSHQVASAPGPPIRSAAFSAPEASASAMTTWAPCSARPAAAARPSPLAPPTTTAFRPSSRNELPGCVIWNLRPQLLERSRIMCRSAQHGKTPTGWRAIGCSAFIGNKKVPAPEQGPALIPQSPERHEVLNRWAQPFQLPTAVAASPPSPPSPPSLSASALHWLTSPPWPSRPRLMPIGIRQLASASASPAAPPEPPSPPVLSKVTSTSLSFLWWWPPLSAATAGLAKASAARAEAAVTPITRLIRMPNQYSPHAVCLPTLAERVECRTRHPEPGIPPRSLKELELPNGWSSAAVAHSGFGVAAVAAVATLAVGLGLALADVTAAGEDRAHAGADRDQAVGLGVGVVSRAAGPTGTAGALEGGRDVRVLVLVATLVHRDSRAGEDQSSSRGSGGHAKNALNEHSAPNLSHYLNAVLTRKRFRSSSSPASNENTPTQP